MHQITSTSTLFIGFSAPFRTALASLLLAGLLAPSLPAPAAAGEADDRLASYFETQTRRLERRALAEVRGAEPLTPEQFASWQENRRDELMEMLGLDPPPEKTDLKATITGTAEHDDFLVERLHFQSRPGLYVTGNLYRPKQQNKPLPAILYVCGHGNVRIDGVSYGSKANYQHHGAWFARNGYICLTIDTLQLGEIEGIHHGTYRYDRWWWLNRGYTPAGVEAWNSVRALDYLQSRPEVDGERLGVTGRSGGGAYSWWLAAIDTRIQAAVPVAGITDLRNYVVDGCVEGHCDCMFMVNTYRWDYPTVAAMVAPRPLLISNTDDDGIFPLDGVVRTHRKVRDVYQLLNAERDVALHITAGPHKDTQELRVHAFRWFNHFLRDDDSLLRMPAEKLMDPKDLKVFEQLPKDERNTTIDESFVAQAPPAEPPASVEAWKAGAAKLRKQFVAKSFRGWPQAPTDGPDDPAPKLKADGAVLKSAAAAPAKASAKGKQLVLERLRFKSQQHVELPLWIVRNSATQPELVVLNVLDSDEWEDLQGTLSQLFPRLPQSSDSPDNGDNREEQEEQEEQAQSMHRMLSSLPWAMAYTAPRGLGPDRWSGDAKKQNQLRRRFYLLGQSLAGMRIWDVRQATRALRTRPSVEDASVWLQAEEEMAGLALHAGLFETYGRIDLHRPPLSYRNGPTLLNVSRFTTLPATLLAVAERSPVAIYDTDAETWSAAAKFFEQREDEELRKRLRIRATQR